jgi:hypothetical protein
MPLPDPRRLAAADMYGTHGSLLRRRIIRAEFIAGVIGCSGLGILTLLWGSGWLIVGVWLIGVGANYLPLAVEAHRLSRPGALERQMAGHNTRGELRWAGKSQLWIALPFAVCFAVAITARDRKSAS